jgi:hypothetical protein
MPKGSPALQGAEQMGVYASTASNTQLRRQGQCQTICRLGARVVFELIDEIDRHYRLGSDRDLRLEAYSRVSPELLRATGGDRMPLDPVCLTRRNGA